MSADSEKSSTLPSATRHVFLSPHYDDIPLSAGATVRLLANNGMTPEAYVIFGSEPDPALPLTEFAQSLHRAWGLSAGEVIVSRQAEEQAAAAILGAKSSVLPFRDAIYRGRLYLSDDDLFAASPSPAEQGLPTSITAALPLPDDPDPATRIYAPLGIGRHVDHQLAFRAGVELADEGGEVWFYEDTPYALKPNASEHRLADIAVTRTVAPVARIPVDDVWEQKIDAILRYPSQLETVFRQYVGVGTDRAEISAALHDYATNAGDGVAAERFWRIGNATH
jgi:LmbE family N-acetylglucosaminyl deacetylase